MQYRIRRGSAWITTLIHELCRFIHVGDVRVTGYQSMIKVDHGLALDKAALVGCGVTTGYGSAGRTGENRDGDTVVVMGVGGVGINAVQAARIAGARNIVRWTRSTNAVGQWNSAPRT